jgi:hypothetical protein
MEGGEGGGDAGSLEADGTCSFEAAAAEGAITGRGDGMVRASSGSTTAFAPMMV